MTATKIVAAACRWNGIIFSMPPPARHHDILNTASQNIEHEDFGLLLGYEQGFLGDDGEFYNRVAAKDIVRIFEQPTIGEFNPAELFSEDLW